MMTTEERIELYKEMYKREYPTRDMLSESELNDPNIMTIERLAEETITIDEFFDGIINWIRENFE